VSNDLQSAVKSIGKLASDIEGTKTSLSDALRFLHDKGSDAFSFIIDNKKECATALLLSILLYGIGSGKYKDSTWKKIMLLSTAGLVMLN
jgi:hypothetical protein